MGFERNDFGIRRWVVTIWYCGECNSNRTSGNAYVEYDMEKLDDISHFTNPSGWYAVLEEIASVALFMASDIGNLVVGDAVYISGGGDVIPMHK